MPTAQGHAGSERPDDQGRIRHAPVSRTSPRSRVVVEGAMGHSRPFAAAPEHQEALGFPGRARRGLARPGESPGWGSCSARSRGLRVFLDSCVKCGACTDKCHYFLGTGDPKNMPVARPGPAAQGVPAPLLTLAGKLFPKLVGAADLTEEVLEGLVPLLPPVLAVPALLGVLPLRHRHPRRCRWRGARSSRASAWGRSTATRSSARSTRSGTTSGCRSRPWPTPSKGWRRTVEEETGGLGALPPRRGGRGGPPRHAVGGLLRRAACRRPHRLRQGVPPGRASAGRAQHPSLGGGELRAVHPAATRTCARWRYGCGKRRWSSG